jgi:putative ABC transport system permease protein
MKKGNILKFLENTSAPGAVFFITERPVSYNRTLPADPIFQAIDNQRNKNRHLLGGKGNICKTAFMFSNFFKISWRNLARNKAYTFINVAGLALSMACCILIFTLVKYHLSFDNFHKDASRVYRFVTEEQRDNTNYAGAVPPAFAKAFRTDYTFGEATANIATMQDEFLTINTGSEIKKFKEKEGISFAEPAYFDIFNFPLVQGDKKTVLKDINTAVITQRMAEKYFGKENPINKTLMVENRIPVKITGVLKNLPDNTDQKAEIFISWPSLIAFNDWLLKDDSWGGITDALQSFVRLRPNVNSQQVEKVLPAYVTKYRAKNRNKHIYHLQPLAEVHFDARYGGVMEKRNLWILSLIGLFILVTACVNFINLATAQALRRSREVGVRKVLGSMRGQLFWQFIAETSLVTLLGVVAAVGLSELLLPSVNTLFKTNMSVNLFSDGILLFFLLILVVVVTFLAGSYPGLILSRFKPVAALKGKISNQHIGGFNTRRALIITQFAISQMLIIGMVVIVGQMHYVKGADLGFDKDAIVMLPIGVDSTGVSAKTVKAQLSEIPGVKKVSICYEAPASNGGWNTSVRYDNHAEDEIFLVDVKAADDQYLPTFGVDLVAGRNIFPADSVREFLVNETFVRSLNLRSPSEIIGKRLSINGGNVKGPVVGVVKDFHDRSFHADIAAVCICSYRDQYQYFAAKIDMRNAASALAAIEKTWNGRYPNQVFEYHFLDERIAEFYETEETMLKLIQAFSCIAIFIGCLGLYGLVMFMAAQKTKEIGIRKVLGGSVSQIIWIFGKEFARLILIAFLIAAPVAGWLMHNWLQNFKFHISLSPLFFAATILLMCMIALLTVGYQVIKAALTNPAKSLKSE